MIDPNMAHAAFDARDRSKDGQFVGAVKTTGIYCKPSCPARRPKPENVEFFGDGAAARAAGYRPCKRCLPDDVARDAAAIERAIAILEGDDPPRLEALAAEVGYAPTHFQRLFVRHMGVSPAIYVRQVKAHRAQEALASGVSVTDAIYAAGYSAPSRFYADAKGYLGMAPSAWKQGGAGVEICWTVADTRLGSMLLAATDKGICRLSFDQGEAELRAIFPKANLIKGGAVLEPLLQGAIAAINTPTAMPDLPLDVDGTPFQKAIWAELRRIPAGEIRSYADLAAAVGKPAAVRAAGSANGANNVAVLIPCHRVIRSDGSLGGYAYGLERKAALLAAEAEGVEFRLKA